jgi:hypothetical protein
VNDVVLVAVVDTAEHLFEKDRRIALAELSSLEHLVEELAALANLSHQVVPLFVFKKFVHLHDVWVVLQ